ncbi:MAG TPA: hypothetical protein VJ934_04005 [Desulfomicrobiaceae bacterium]|nr:hypothetical protein [Desulfomicrobiaceae bacterium]
MKKLLLICVVLMHAHLIHAAPMDEIWSEVHPRLSEALHKLEARADAPDSSWNPLTPDRTDLQQDIESILDSCMDLLGGSNLTDIRSEVAALQEDSRAARERVAALKTARPGAPKEVRKWKFWKNDLADLEEAIADHQGRILENERRIQNLLDNMVTELRGMGISATREQVETLVYSVTADDDIRIMAVFHNIRFFTSELRKLTMDSGEDLTMARRYYGLHTMLMNILVLLYDNYLNRVDQIFLPRIEAILDHHSGLMRRTEEELRTAAAQHRKIYRANLDAQRLTGQTARLYRDYLIRNRDRVHKTRNEIFSEFKLARNTYETVQSAHALKGVMRNASAMLSRLTGLQGPELMVFSNTEMRREFKKLTERIRTGSE